MRKLKTIKRLNKSKGWRQEPIRHALSAKGIKSGRKTTKKRDTRKYYEKRKNVKSLEKFMEGQWQKYKHNKSLRKFMEELWHHDKNAKKSLKKYKK